MVLIPLPSYSYTPQTNKRIKFKRGSVAINSTSMMITLDDLVYEGFTIIGTIVGESIFNINKMRGSEFDVVIREVEIPVLEYDVEEIEESRQEESRQEGSPTSVQPEPVKTKSKKRIKLDYEDEDDGFKMGNVQEMEKRKGRGQGPVAPALAPEPAPASVEVPVKDMVDKSPVKDEPAAPVSSSDAPVSSSNADIHDPSEPNADTHDPSEPNADIPEPISSDADTPDKSVAVSPDLSHHPWFDPLIDAHDLPSPHSFHAHIYRNPTHTN